MPMGLLEEVELRVQARHRAELVPMRGLLSALKTLRAVPKCVASSSTPASLALKLEVTGLNVEFAPHIFSTAQVARGKPAPDIWLHAAACMRVAPAACIVIEDSRHGIAGAKVAGMRVIGFTGASRASAERAAELRDAGADSVIGAMDDLPAAVHAMLP
jgi:HAD superfamily hydrolase (TIGR01509 family)